jgi:ubiquitin C-terminal hydrolase
MIVQIVRSFIMTNTEPIFQEFLRCFMDQIHEELMEPTSSANDVTSDDEELVSTL